MYKFGCSKTIYQMYLGCSKIQNHLWSVFREPNTRFHFGTPKIHLANVFGTLKLWQQAISDIGTLKTQTFYDRVVSISDFGTPKIPFANGFGTPKCYNLGVCSLNIIHILSVPKPFAKGILGVPKFQAIWRRLFSENRTVVLRWYRILEHPKCL